MNDPNRKIGPHEKRLIARKFSMLAVPDGGGLPDAIGSLADPHRMKHLASEATEWVRQAIQAVKDAPDNPYGDDSEAIAGEILRQIEFKQRGRK